MSLTSAFILLVILAIVAMILLLLAAYKWTITHRNDDEHSAD